jgi:uncharacterized protein (DUF427 family)
MSDEPAVRDYPQMITPFNHIEPVPRRIRGYLAGETVFDTVSARYVWEWAKYPQYYMPLADVDSAVLIDEDHPQRLSRGTARQHALQVGETIRPAAARVYGADALPGRSIAASAEDPLLPVVGCVQKHQSSQRSQVAVKATTVLMWLRGNNFPESCRPAGDQVHCCAQGFDGCHGPYFDRLFAGSHVWQPQGLFRA